MNTILNGSLAEYLGGLLLALTLALVGWAWRRRRSRALGQTAAGGAAPVPLVPPQVRRYTLLGTLAPDGSPAQITSTRPARTAITYRAGGLAERFELTDALLHDGTYAAEPLDRYV
ncbi:hypothetical protein SAVIM338S_07308 [Streptomyces avidinii]